MHSAELFQHIVNAYLMEASHVLQYWKFIIRSVRSENKLPEIEVLKFDKNDKEEHMQDMSIK